MGEYALFGKQEIKIGTCEEMFYLRHTDRHRVRRLPGNIDAGTQKNLYWRLPFPDEDEVQPGSYQSYNRGERLYQGTDDFSYPQAAESPGLIQLRHPLGLLVNMPCYHGEQLPDVPPTMKVFWNGKSWSYELASVKNTPEGVFPIVRCRHCGESWRFTWEEILPFVSDLTLRERLSIYRRP